MSKIAAKAFFYRYNTNSYTVTAHKVRSLPLSTRSVLHGQFFTWRTKINQRLKGEKTLHLPEPKQVLQQKRTNFYKENLYTCFFFMAKIWVFCTCSPAAARYPWAGKKKKPGNSTAAKFTVHQLLHTRNGMEWKSDAKVLPREVQQKSTPQKPNAAAYRSIHQQFIGT